MRKVLSAVLMICALAAVKSVRAQAPTPNADQNSPVAAAAVDPKALGALKQQIEEILKSVKSKQKDQFHTMVSDLRLRDEKTWFATVFGAEMGGKMAQIYAADWPNFEQELEKTFKTVHDDKRTDVSTHEATARVLLSAPRIAAIMKTPTLLYAVSASKHGKAEWSLSGVYVAENDRYRCIPPAVFAPDLKIKSAVRLAPNIVETEQLTSVPPVYPPEARAAHVTGTVVLHVIIGTDGSVEHIYSESGPTQLTEAAANAVSQWRYRPTLLNGIAVEVETTISVKFSLGHSH